MGKGIFCSCHATWLPCKTSIMLTTYHIPGLLILVERILGTSRQHPCFLCSVLYMYRHGLQPDVYSTSRRHLTGHWQTLHFKPLLKRTPLKQWTVVPKKYLQFIRIYVTRRNMTFITLGNKELNLWYKTLAHALLVKIVAMNRQSVMWICCKQNLSKSVLSYFFKICCGKVASFNSNVTQHPFLVGLLQDILFNCTLTD